MFAAPVQPGAARHGREPLPIVTQSTPLPREAAELTGLEALGWIAGQPELAGRFLDAAGAGPDDLRARACDLEFLGFVLDFLLADEATLLAFAKDAGLPPDRPLRARAALPGGELPHWT